MRRPHLADAWKRLAGCSRFVRGAPTMVGRRLRVGRRERIGAARDFGRLSCTALEALASPYLVVPNRRGRRVSAAARRRTVRRSIRIINGIIEGVGQQAAPWQTVCRCDQQQPLFVVPPASWYALGMTEEIPKRRRWFQFRLRTLLLLAVLMAAVGSVLAPFRPKISFSDTGPATYIDNDGSEVPLRRVTVTNAGAFSIWYPGWDGFVHNYWCTGWSSDGEPHSCGYSIEPLSWTRLRPGESVEIQVPIKLSYTALDVFLEVKDWRGRMAGCRSEIFEFSNELTAPLSAL